MNTFSATTRQETIARLASETYDLVIVGGGITGAGIALDAASRGMKVALLEKGDFASGTSSKSTKLIHGGLRYLKQLEIGLVREVGRERAIVHRLAPHLVHAEKMLLPLIEGGTFGLRSTSLGLRVYDLLAGVKKADRRRMLSKKEALLQEPLLQAQESILNGAGFYAEYRTDDARLTIENLKTAAAKGALCLNYAEVTGFQYDAAGEVTGVRCSSRLGGRDFEVRGRFVVSAAGPWVDTLRQADRSLEGKRIFLSKGVHIVVPRERLPLRQSVYFDVPDGRMVFAIPRQRSTYIGTTDTPYEGSLDDIPITAQDVSYLLRAVNNMFPGVKLQYHHVESGWAGLRPLIYEPGKSASEMSRKDEIFESPSGLISIAGGKLTGYRKMAQRIVDLVSNKAKTAYGSAFQPCSTERIPIFGGPFEDDQAVARYRADLRNKLTTMYNLPSAYWADYLVANYGRQTETILDRMAAFDDEPAVALTRAEAWFAVHHEMAATLLDFFDRRTGRLFFNLPSIAPVLPLLRRDFQTYLGWSDQRTEQEERETMALLERYNLGQIGKAKASS
jgi:glycerol-3-phosphate dehydrogenase